MEVHVTQRALDAKRVVERRGYDMDLIVGSGGDGTLNEVVSGVMGMERRPNRYTYRPEQRMILRPVTKYREI